MSKFDAVVIGSGTGGLSAALSLATAGKKILLLEQHNVPGGCATSFVRGRFEFDASLHEFCSLGYPGNWAMTGKLLMEKYKLNIDWCLVPDLYRCIGTTRSGKHFDLRFPCGIRFSISRSRCATKSLKSPAMRTKTSWLPWNAPEWLARTDAAAVSAAGAEADCFQAMSLFRRTLTEGGHRINWTDISIHVLPLQ